MVWELVSDRSVIQTMRAWPWSLDRYWTHQTSSEGRLYKAVLNILLMCGLALGLQSTNPPLFAFSPPTLAHLGPSLATLTTPFLPMLLPIRATQPQPTLPPQTIKSPFQRINLPPSHNYQVCCRAIKSPLVLRVLPIKNRTQLGTGRRELRANSHMDRNDKA